jgi:hypothetical protein
MTLRAKRDCVAVETVAEGVEIRRAVFKGQPVPPWLKVKDSDVEDDKAVRPEDYERPPKRRRARS